MHQAAVEVYNLLNTMRTNLEPLIPNDVPLNQLWGWNLPSVTKGELLQAIADTQRHLENVPEAANHGDLVVALSVASQRLHWFLANVLPNVAGGNAGVVVSAMRDELTRVDRIADDFIPVAAPPTPDWRKLAEEGYLPKKIAARFAGMEQRLDKLAPQMDTFEHKVAVIQDAFQTADQFPETLASLEEEKRLVTSARIEAQSLAAEAAQCARDAGASGNEIGDLAEEAKSKFAELDDAYRAAATKGLASSFQNKASTLGISVRLWVAVLVFDLAAGAIIAYLRFEELQKILSTPQTAPVVWGNLAFSVLSLAAPVWLGWVATKQINQRFKLAEDYAFKATVASAYEAWKAEAKKHDKAFEQRLFSSALSRLEEAPLRFVETESYGSPWHEFTSSPAFAKALDTLPDLRASYDRFATAAGSAASSAGSVLGALHRTSNGTGNGSAAREGVSNG